MQKRAESGTDSSSSPDSGTIARARNVLTEAHRVRWGHDRVVGFLLFLPAVFIMVGLVAYPIIRVLSFGLYKLNIFFTTKEFVGLDNYIKILQWPDFWADLKNAVIFTVGSVFFQLIAGLLVALLLNEDFPGRNIARSVILFSYLVPIVVAALIWKYMLNDIFGIVNYTINMLKLPIPTTWFASPDTAMPTLILFNVWKFFPFMVIVFLAQLQSIDPVLYEAAKVDGANRLQAFWYITLPSLKPVIFIALMLRTIWTFNNFEVINLLTGGGPMGTTETPALLIYRVTFGQYSIGTGAAISSIMSFLLLGLCVIYLRLYESAQTQLAGES